MSAHRKLTDDDIAYVRRIAGIRRRIAARLKKLPTNDQIAAKLGVSTRLVDRYSTCAQTDGSRGTDSNQYRVHITDEEFEQLMRTE